MKESPSLTRSYSCYGQIIENSNVILSKNKKNLEDTTKVRSKSKNNKANSHNKNKTETSPTNRPPGFVILHGRKIVRKKKRKCVKCKFAIFKFTSNGNFGRLYFTFFENCLLQFLQMFFRMFGSCNLTVANVDPVWRVSQKILQTFYLFHGNIGAMFFKTTIFLFWSLLDRIWSNRKCVRRLKK